MSEKSITTQDRLIENIVSAFAELTGANISRTLFDTTNLVATVGTYHDSLPTPKREVIEQINAGEFGFERLPFISDSYTAFAFVSNFVEGLDKADTYSTIAFYMTELSSYISELAAYASHFDVESGTFEH